MKQVLNKIKAYRVWSDNFEGILMTPEAYKELILTMSTGDYSQHYSKVEYVEDFSGLVTTEELNDPFFNYDSIVEVDKKQSIDNVIHVDFVRKCRIS